MSHFDACKRVLQAERLVSKQRSGFLQELHTFRLGRDAHPLSLRRKREIEKIDIPVRFFEETDGLDP